MNMNIDISELDNFVIYNEDIIINSLRNAKICIDLLLTNICSKNILESIIFAIQSNSVNVRIIHSKLLDNKSLELLKISIRFIFEHLEAHQTDLITFYWSNYYFIGSNYNLILIDHLQNNEFNFKSNLTQVLLSSHNLGNINNFDKKNDIVKDDIQQKGFILQLNHINNIPYMEYLYNIFYHDLKNLKTSYSIPKDNYIWWSEYNNINNNILEYIDNLIDKAEDTIVLNCNNNVDMQIFNKLLQKDEKVKIKVFLSRNILYSNYQLIYNLLNKDNIYIFIDFMGINYINTNYLLIDNLELFYTSGSFNTDYHLMKNFYVSIKNPKYIEKIIEYTNTHYKYTSELIYGTDISKNTIIEGSESVIYDLEYKD